MRNLILLFILIAITTLIGCKGKDPAPAGAVAASCAAFALDSAILTSYTGTTVTTIGTCGEEYDVTGDIQDGQASISGYRMLTATLVTTGGNLSMGNPRFQAAPVLEQFGVTYGGVDNTTCQNDSAQNGVADIIEFNVTAEFNSDCIPQLRGTFREYSRCVDNSEVTICSGTITITR